MASEDRGIDEVWGAINAHRAHLQASGLLRLRQQRLLRLALRGLVSAQLQAKVTAALDAEGFSALLERIQARETSLGQAGAEVLEGVLSR